MPFILSSSQTLATLLLLPVIVFAIWRLRSEKQRNIRLTQRSQQKFIKSLGVGPSQETSNQDLIEPLVAFDLSKVKPIDYRPYRTQGHVSMGIMKRTRNEWIRMDCGYLSRIRERQRLIKEHPKSTIGTGPLVNPAIEELYSEIMINYLPQRYPTLFKVSGDFVRNIVTGSRYPISTTSLTPEEMLQLLAVNVEEDFYFMCPDQINNDFRLQGYIACFPGGFLSPARVGESVREIHQPVPGYEERLGKSVDRYFRRMAPGQFIGRMNWSLQVDGADLFRIDGNNYYPNKAQAVAEEKFYPDFAQCFLRVEHQTLTCLPRSKAIIFCVRSYMTPLEKIKAEGDGPELAAAIESMPEQLGLYKMRDFWGGKVLPWLKEPNLSV